MLDFNKVCSQPTIWGNEYRMACSAKWCEEKITKTGRRTYMHEWDKRTKDTTSTTQTRKNNIRVTFIKTYKTHTHKTRHARNQTSNEQVLDGASRKQMNAHGHKDKMLLNVQATMLSTLAQRTGGIKQHSTSAVFFSPRSNTTLAYNISPQQWHR